MIRALPRVALQLWIVLFIVFFGAEVIHLEPMLRIITQVLFGVPLAAWAAWRLRGPSDRLDWTVLALLVVFAVACLLGRDRTESLGTFALAIAYAAWFLLMRRSAAFGLREPIVVAAATGLAVTLAFNAFLLIQEKVNWYAAVRSAPFEGVMTFPWESVNALPVLVLIAIPFAAWLPRSAVRTVLGVAIGLAALVVVPVSLGRAGWLGLAVCGLVLVVLDRRVGRRLRASSSTLRVANGVGLAFVAVLALVVVGPRIVSSIGESGRLLLWEQDLAMIGRAPLTGFGPGVYSWVRLEFPPATANLLAVRLTHSVPLQTLVDGGIVLFVGVAAALGMWVWVALGRAREWGWPERFAAAALIGFLAALTLDDFSYLPAITAAALALAGILTPVAQASRPRGWSLPVALALFAVFALPSVVAVDSARAAGQEGRTLMTDGSYVAAAAAFERATDAHPENGGYWLGLGMARSWAGDDADAIAAYERARDAAPGDPRAYAALAALGPDAAVAQLLEDASRRTLGNPVYAIRLGVALAAEGRTDEATLAWGRAVSLVPQLLGSLPYESASVSVDEVAAAAVEIIRAEPRPAPVENLGKLWDIALAQDELPTDAGPAWRAVAAARHGDLDAASAFAVAAVEAAGHDPRSHQAAAAVAAFACDEAAERRALDLEQATGHGWAPLEPEPRTGREFVFREASLGASQPPGVDRHVELDRWPWTLVDRPACDT